jgi:sulfide:quinone oxidoreductase
VDAGRKSLPCDCLVVALGAELAPEVIPALTSAHTFYTLEGSARLRAALESIRAGTVAVVGGGLPYKCPGALHEGAMLLADFFRRHRRDHAVDVHLLTPEPQPMPVAGPVLGDAVRQILDSRRVLFHPSHRLVGVDADARELRFDGQPPRRYDLLVAIPPHRAPAVARVGWRASADRRGSSRLR